MTHRSRRLGASLLAALLAACAPGDPQPGDAEQQAGSGLPEGHPAIGNMGAPGTALTGVVKETMSGGGYTYALLDLGDREIWVAGPETALEPGQAVSLPDTANMGTFEVTSLGRTFEELYFTGGFSTMAPPEVAAVEFQGVVKDKIDTAGYTYLMVEAGDTTVWLAAPEAPVEVGQTVGWNGGMLMSNFHSNSLNRNFEVLYFVERVSVVPPGA